MKAILDTNFIYYWCGISDGTYCPEKITNQLNEFEETAVSSWALIEVLTTSKYDLQQKKEVISFLNEKHFPILICDSKHQAFLTPDLESEFDSSQITSLIKIALVHKAEAESGALYLVITLATLVLYDFLSNKAGLSEVQKYNYRQHIEGLIVGNRDYINKRLRNTLADFYSDNSESIFKNTIAEIVYSLFFVASVNFNLIQANQPLSDYISTIGTSEDKSSILRESLRKSKIHKKILRYINVGELKCLIGNDKQLLDSSLNFIEVEFNSQIVRGTLKYYLEFIKKILVESAKLSKNDMIDSFMMAFYPEYQILSADRRMGNIAESIDAEYWKVTKAFLANTHI
jgi:hypothetical protein